MSCILYREVEFEWDRIKREQNLRSHDVDFVEAEEVFDDQRALVEFDEKHSLAEERFRILGKTRSGRLLLTVFTPRGSKIRIISSRRASRREAKGYEEGI